MYGERTNGIYLVLSHCDDPAKEPEFNDWYDAHLGEMVATGLFHRATRYELATPGTAEPYLTVYETNEPLKRIADEMDAAIEELRGEGKIDASAVPTKRLLLETMTPGTYCFEGKEASQPTGLLLMANNPKTPGTDDAFNAWYDDVHRLDIEATGMYATMNRFSTVGEHEVRYANLYETGLDDVARVLTGLDEFRPKWQEAGTLYADRVNTLRGAYRLRLTVGGGG